jgi:nitrite reductase/ring-hydroxylating ferredoxin subunit
MTRYEFLKDMGFKGGALMAVLASCTSEEDAITQALVLKPATNTPVVVGQPTGTTGIVANATTAQVNAVTSPLYTLDLAAASNAALLKVGGYVIVNAEIVVGLVANNKLAAASRTCTHEPRKKVVLQGTEFYCQEHGARFSTEGKGLNSLGNNGITTYKVLSDGKKLVITR